MTTEPLLLSDLPVGAAAVVRAVEPGPVGEGRRLRDLGFVPGTLVRVERRAPLGDPTVYELRSTRLALRREAASLVRVEPVDADARTPSATSAARGMPT
jgi:Fe2+ transport system protein FeoA